MKYQILFSLKKRAKFFMNVLCCSRVLRFKGKMGPFPFFILSEVTIRIPSVSENSPV